MNITVLSKVKGIGKRTLLVSLLSIFAGSTATIAAFAAIPNSTTGLISGCVGKFTGVMRAVDTQAGANCTPLESSISWPSASAVTNQGKNALLYLSQSVTDNLQLTLDTTKSHNIVAAQIVNDPTPGSSNQWLCVQVSFDPLVASPTNLVPLSGSVGIGGPVTSGIQGVTLSSTSTDTAGTVAANCGSGYNAMFRYVAGNAPAIPVAYMFFS